MSSRKTLYVCVSLDVEEEGLFGGHYEITSPSLENISFLPKLIPLSRQFRLPLTLFCAYSVFSNSRACKTLDYMRENCAVEIGAHLHHWNTPPLENGKSGAPERTHLLKPELLNARLNTLLEAAEKYLGYPATSFRMGRWDLKAPILELLAARGIKTDSSICPLRCFPGGPNHFLAPVKPYWRITGAGKILVAPITQTPVFASLAHCWHSFAQKKPAMLDKFHFFGALSPNPFWHGNAVMRMAARKLVAEGGNILNMFWHSSEIMPGGSPQTPNQSAAERHLKKIHSFFTWLCSHYHVIGLTMSQLANMDDIFHFPVLAAEEGRDW